jgi:hypothetical protein
MNEGEIKAVVIDAVHETLKSLGVNMDEPFEVQRDFQYLRSWRTAVQTVKTAGLKASVGVFVTGLLGLVWAKMTGKI